MTPRNYLSYSQYNLFKKSPERYKKVYILGEDNIKNRYTEFGRKIALIREGKEITEDKIINMMLDFLPSYPNREEELRVRVKVGRKFIVLLGRCDGVDFEKHIIADDKTGKKWTQKMADNSEQLTWYAYLYYKKFKIIPSLEINWIETEEEFGQVVATGNIKTFKTTRTVKDFIKLQSEINKVWLGIEKMVELEWSKVV